MCHVHRLTDLVNGKIADGSPWSIEERALARTDMGAAVRLAKDSIDILASASGGSSVHQNVPIQDIQRDADAINLHALTHPDIDIDIDIELYGPILCGRAPDTLYV